MQYLEKQEQEFSEIRGGKTMSCFYVSHTSKHNQVALKGIGIHNERKTENSSNKDIDKSKSEENYDLHNEQGLEISYEAKVQEILDENYKTGVKLRANSVKMVSTVISASPEFFQGKNEEEVKDYFQKNYEYLKWKIGEKNVVSAKVHLDEKTPHMHFCCVPITPDGRLSAKELFDRNSLRDLQSEPVKILQKTFPELQRGRSNTTGKSLHVTPNELKKRDAEERFKELEKTKLDKESVKNVVSKIKETKGEKTGEKILGFFVERERKFVLTSSELESFEKEALKVSELEEINQKLVEEKLALELSNERLGQEKRALVLEKERIEREEFYKRMELREIIKSERKEFKEAEHVVSVLTKRLEDKGLDSHVKPKSKVNTRDFER